MRVAIGVEEHGATGPGNANHFADALRHVRKQHHAKLRSDDVEAVIREFERVPVHDTSLDCQPLLLGARREKFELTGDLSVANTCAPRRAAGMLSAPLPAATSRNRIPERSPTRRRPSLPSHFCVGVLVLS